MNERESPIPDSPSLDPLALNRSLQRGDAGYQRWQAAKSHATELLHVDRQAAAFATLEQHEVLREAAAAHDPLAGAAAAPRRRRHRDWGFAALCLVAGHSVTETALAMGVAEAALRRALRTSKRLNRRIAVLEREREEQLRRAVGGMGELLLQAARARIQVGDHRPVLPLLLRLLAGGAGPARTLNASAQVRIDERLVEALHTLTRPNGRKTAGIRLAAPTAAPESAALIRRNKPE